MKRKELEMLLQKIPPHPEPNASLEQYQTPAGIAADILFEAYAAGHIAGLDVVDLGCGTGMFAIGAALLGASITSGFDADETSIALAKTAAARAGVDDRTSFYRTDIDRVSGKFDTCIMNPPFGYQKKGSDRPFIKKALEVAHVTYCIHHTEARAHVEGMVSSVGRITLEQNYKFPMPFTYAFHSRHSRPVEVTLFRFERAD